MNKQTQPKRNNSNPIRQCVSFIFDEDSLKAGFGPEGTSLASEKIEKYMLNSGFEKSKYLLDYSSVNPMTVKELYGIFDDMKEKMPWIPKCIKAAPAKEVVGEPLVLFKTEK